MASRREFPFRRLPINQACALMNTDSWAADEGEDRERDPNSHGWPSGQQALTQGERHGQGESAQADDRGCPFLSQLGQEELKAQLARAAQLVVSTTIFLLILNLRGSEHLQVGAEI
jgi:hypothetical protein